MKFSASPIRNAKDARQGPVGKRVAGVTRRWAGRRTKTKGEGSMEPEARSGRMEAVAAHPLAEILDCPPVTKELLNGAAQSIDFDAGETVFRQSGACRGLYVVVSGQFLRKTERLETRLMLAPVRAGDLVELAAALGDCRHTYTLCAQTPGSMLLLPMEALNQAFQSYPPLRMHLLEELAREVSRAYNVCCMNRTVKTRRQVSEAATA